MYHRLGHGGDGSELMNFNDIGHDIHDLKTTMTTLKDIIYVVLIYLTLTVQEKNVILPESKKFFKSVRQSDNLFFLVRCAWFPLDCNAIVVSYDLSMF